MRGPTAELAGGGRALLGRGRALAPAVAAVTGALLLVSGLTPAPAHAVDLFPIDDWIGDGLKSVGKVVLGPLKLGAEGIAKLLGAIVAALADLLVPKSLIEAGVGAIRWLVELPPLGADPTSRAEVVSAPMPHLRELRDTLTWIGLTLLPLQLVVAGGRAVLSPTADGDSPTDVLRRTIAAALGLIAFDWLWGVLTELVRLITSSLLSLPWVADGVERMLEALVIGGAAGTAVAAEFVVPLILAVAGGALLALMLLRVGLEVMAAIIYATGGLALGLSVSGAGARLLQAWMVAATAVFVLPVLWCVVFVCGAALMLDAGSSESGGGFGDFVAQLYNVGAALVTFVIAIKLARATLGHAGAAMAGLAAVARHAGGTTRGGIRALSPTSAGAPGRATPQSLVRFSQNLRGGMRGAAVGTARAGVFPVRHPSQAVAYARHPVQSTRSAVEERRTATKDDPAGRRPGGGTAAGGGRRREGSAAGAADQRGKDGAAPAQSPRRSSAQPAAPPIPHADRPARGKTAGRAAASIQQPPKPGRRASRPSGGSHTAAETHAGEAQPPPATRPKTDAATAKAWRATRRIVVPQRSTTRPGSKRKGKRS